MSAPQIPSRNEPRIIRYPVSAFGHGRSAPPSRRESTSSPDVGAPFAPPSPSARSYSQDSLESMMRKSTLSPQAERRRSRPKDDSLIMVMGVTGSGKSTFISKLSDEDVKVGHSLVSTTAEVQDYRFRTPDGRAIRLIDTPGFDDTNRSDADILRTIATELNGIHDAGRRVDGVIYLHRITDTRMSGSAVKSLEVLRRLCGEHYFPQIALVTTRWQLLKDRDGHEDARAREAELKSDPYFWADLIEGGSRTFRHDGSRERALEIVTYLTTIKHKGPLRIQVQMGRGKRLVDTDAGSFVEGEIAKMSAKYEKEIAQLESELRLANDSQERELFQEQAQQTQSRMQRLKQDEKTLLMDAMDLDDQRGSRRPRSSSMREIERTLSTGETEMVIVSESRRRESRTSDDESDREEHLRWREEQLNERERRLAYLESQIGHERRHLEVRKSTPNEPVLLARRRQSEKKDHDKARKGDREHKLLGYFASTPRSPRSPQAMSPGLSERDPDGERRLSPRPSETVASVIEHRRYR